MRGKKRKKFDINDFFNWSLTFTKKLIVICTALWALFMTYAAIMILFAVFKVNDFSYLDTFITDNGETFRLVVGTNIISKTIENVFKFNNGGIFGTSLPYEEPGNYKDDPPEGGY